MKVHLSFDIEVWCGGWDHLDQRFPTSFERYVHGRSSAGDYALPKTLEILQRHGLTGVFFVEPLFSARFGAAHLRTITDMIQAAGQDLQLHLHPEWTDEISPPPIADVSRKRQHLTYYTLAEQTALIGLGKRLLEQAKGSPVTAFRAGSFAANHDTFRALAANGMTLDSSLNECHDHAEGSLADWPAGGAQRQIDTVHSFPVTVFTDGLGRLRPAQVGACSFAELRSAMLRSAAAGAAHFVIVSHNFEMLKPGSSQPDRIVVKRFEQLCAFLASVANRMPVGPFLPPATTAATPVDRPAVPWPATARRHAEQLLRRWV